MKNNEKKETKITDKKVFSTILSFPYYLARKDMEDYPKWEIGATNLLSEDRVREMRILGTLEKLGYPLNHIGTHLFKEFIVEIYDELKRSDSKDCYRIFRDVASDKSSIRKYLACEYLETSDGNFKKYISEAMNLVDQDKKDKEYARSVYGPNGESENIGIMAYKIAQDHKLWEESFDLNLVGSFTATTFSDEDIIFNVYDNNIIECLTLDINKVRNINLKPRFELNSEVMHYTYDVPSKMGDSSKLIKEYNIDEDLMDYLLSNGMVKYSQDMAILYGFDVSKSYDRNGGYPFKRAAKKGPILTMEKHGFFN